MRCQAASGERGRTIRHYEELVELLDVQSGTAPAPETRALRERLRAGEEVRAFFRRRRLTAFFVLRGCSWERRYLLCHMTSFLAAVDG